MLRVVLFGSGGAMPTAALKSLSRHHQVIAIVHPITSRWRSKAGDLLRPLRKQDLFRTEARYRAIQEIGAVSGKDEHMVRKLRELKPDLLCVASFPWLLSEQVISMAGLGAINVHPSLLPRHRGPNPFFWIYYHDDRDTGVTAHMLTLKADAGGIVAQVRFELPRGYSLNKLHERVSSEGGELLAKATTEMEAGTCLPKAQDEALATSAPKVKPDTPMVDFEKWPVERVWHFLAGLFPHFKEPLQGVNYSAVDGYSEAGHSCTPGSVEKIDTGWRLYCRDGYVDLAKAGRE